MRKTHPPLTLGEVVPSAPRAWRGALIRLEDAFRAIGLPLRVYGSLAWQHIARQAYVTERSDVDVLFRPESRGQLDRALAVLRDWERCSGLRADGEALLPDGSGVAWRELLQARSRVLVKCAGSVELREVTELLDTMETGAET